jgi:exopolyphosphatase/guanosine-5'-triphosphate,3'-diphosphate pyrophosphatase
MQPERRAVIDVGTNSVKVLVAEVAGREVRPVWEESKQTRLGQGFYETHRLQPAPIAKTAEAVAGFAARARQEGAGSLQVIATSAARDAVNACELTSAIQQSSGLPVEIISGEQEAEWAFQGVTTDRALAQTPLLILEAGGGSTQLILGHGTHTDFRESYPLGTVRLLEQTRPGDPPRKEELAACRGQVREFLRKAVLPALEPAMRRETKFQAHGGKVQLVGTGGTASILGCMEAGLDHFDRARLETTRLSRARFNWHVERLWGLSLEARQQLVGLPKNRADVILTGAVIYEAVTEQCGFHELRISTRGLRFGALLAGAI